MCLPGHFPISPLRSQRAAPRGLSGPLQQHPGAQRPQGPQHCSCCLSRALLLPARSTGGFVSLGASEEMAVNRGFGQGALEGHARGTEHKGQQPHVAVWTQGKVLSWAGGAGQRQHPQGSRKQPRVCVSANGWIPCSRCHACVHTRCTLISTLQASLSSAQDPAVSTGCSMGRGPQEELQHSHSTRQRLPINN